LIGGVYANGIGVARRYFGGCGRCTGFPPHSAGEAAATAAHSI